MRQFPINAIAMGTPDGSYSGAFGHVIKKHIEDLCSGSVLHLFSGSSKIGDERVDNAHANATHNCDVFDFIRRCDQVWDVVLLDPPYEKTSRLCSYIESPLSNNVPRRRELVKWFTTHAKRVVWLDNCAPIFEPFDREKVWLVMPGGFRRVRVLTVLVNRALSAQEGESNL